MWLEGTWASGDSIGFSGEAWTKANSKLLLGEGLFNMPDNSIMIEELSIHISGDKMYYSAIVPDQNEGREVSFMATYIGADSLVFENPEHDYPKKIIYSLNHEKQLEVHIIGEDDAEANILTLSKI
jgi:hypothetical protein